MVGASKSTIKLITEHENILRGKSRELDIQLSCMLKT